MPNLAGVLLAFLFVVTYANYADREFLVLRYDRSKMPWDLRPVQNYIGLWALTSTTGRSRDLPPPDQIDFAINPVPKFGARAINIT
ncbi:hypothetical protein OSTOST_04699 [Ostertagia ostertagi]